MKSVDQIQEILKSIDVNQKNNTGDIFLNQINNEFITINEKIEIPKIPVKELDYNLSIDIINDLIKYIPEFLINHTLLKIRKPASEQQSLHFINQYRGKHIYFIHIFRIDLRFSGDPTNIIEQGNSDFYPSYTTDRIYYKSRLVPEISILKHKGSIIDFNPIRLKTASNVESDQHFHTFAIFDELNTSEISRELCNQITPDIFNVSTNLYPFISFDYFTAAFNIIYPLNNEIEKAIKFFEPLFIILYSKYFDFTKLITKEELNEKFNFEIEINDSSINLKNGFITQLSDYFKRFNLVRDEKMALKGWRRFEIH